VSITTSNSQKIVSLNARMVEHNINSKKSTLKLHCKQRRLLHAKCAKADVFLPRGMLTPPITTRLHLQSSTKNMKETHTVREGLPNM